MKFTHSKLAFKARKCMGAHTGGRGAAARRESRESGKARGEVVHVSYGYDPAGLRVPGVVKCERPSAENPKTASCEVWSVWRKCGDGITKLRLITNFKCMPTNGKSINAAARAVRRYSHEQISDERPRRHARNADSLPRLPMMAERYDEGTSRGHVGRAIVPMVGWMGAIPA